MALPENPDEADENQEAVSGNDVGGARDGRHPISTTDAFAGELPAASNADALSEALDIVSKNTVVQQLGGLSISALGAVPQNVVKDNVNEHANEVASSHRARECLANSTENPVEALNAPPLSLNSLTSSLPPPPVQTDNIVTRNGLDDDPDVRAANFTTETGRQCNLTYFAETHQPHQHQQHHDLTSGYVSECPQQNGRVNNRRCRSKESRVNTVSCRTKQSKPKKSSCRSNKTSKERCISHSEFLQMSEEGLKKLLLMSGTQHKPVYKDYHSFVARLQSFKDLSCVHGVKKDILSLAGFFCSGSGTVTCYHCGCSPRIWPEGSDPQRLHCQWTPNCRFIRTIAKRLSRDI